MIDVKAFCVGNLDTNCYLLIDADTQNMAVVDPGAYSRELCEYIEKIGGNKLLYVFLTHGHFDHIGYAKQLSDKFGAKICIGEFDKDFLSNGMLNLSQYCGESLEPFNADITLKDSEIIELGNTKIQFIHTPGHTIGSGCYVFDNCILSGDTLFCESMGRTDFISGSYDDMMKSLKRLISLDGDYNVYPGHSAFTTLSHERKYNPCIR